MIYFENCQGYLTNLGFVGFSFVFSPKAVTQTTQLLRPLLA